MQRIEDGKRKILFHEILCFIIVLFLLVMYKFIFFYSIYIYIYIYIYICVCVCVCVCIIYLCVNWFVSSFVRSWRYFIIWLYMIKYLCKKWTGTSISKIIFNQWSKQFKNDFVWLLNLGEIARDRFKHLFFE